MKEKEKNRISLSNGDSLLYTKEIIEPTFCRNIMNQKINKKRDVILPREITKRKKIIYDLFQKKFGPNFLEKKPESLSQFESLFGKYFFSPKSNFLKKFFPKIYKKIFHDKKIDLKKLKSKINIGSMIYLTLRKHLVSNKSLISDKLLYISKNYSTINEKDLVSNLYLKYKKDAIKRKNKVLKSSSKNLHYSTKSLNFGDISRVNSDNIELKDKNVDNKKEIKENKKNIFNFESEKKKIDNKFFENSFKLSKTHNNFYRRNKNIVKFKTSLIKDGRKNKNNTYLSKNLAKIPSSEINDNSYKKYYLLNPFYMYNSNIYNRNNNKYKTSQSDNMTNIKDNFNNPQSTFNSHKPNISLSNSSVDPFKIRDSSLSQNNKIVSFKNVHFNVNKKIELNNIKTISNKIPSNKMISIDEKENSKLYEDEIKEKNELSINIPFGNHKRNNFILNEKNSFDKYLRRKKRKVKNRINSEAKLLNNCTNKCNKKLIKLIDKNFILDSKQKQKYQSKNVNFDITKLLLDDKIPKKVFVNYAKSLNTIKPIVKKTLHDLTKFDKRDKNLGKKYFIKNINNMPTDLALYFIGELYQTSHVKFGLKEYERKREEQKLIKDEINLKKLRIKSKDNLFRMKQLEYILLNERDAFFNSEKEKIKNMKLYNKIHGIEDIKTNDKE